MGWQPIETAPKDGALLLLSATPTGPLWIGCWWRDGWYSEGWQSATHWMPLPEPPAIAMETGTAIDSEAGVVAKP